MNGTLGGMRAPSAPPAPIEPIAIALLYLYFIIEGYAICPMVMVAGGVIPVIAAKMVHTLTVPIARAPGM